MNKITFTVRRNELKDLEIKGDLVENLSSFATAIKAVIRGYSSKMEEKKGKQFEKDMLEMVKAFLLTDEEIKKMLDKEKGGVA